MEKECSVVSLQATAPEGIRRHWLTINTIQVLSLLVAKHHKSKRYTFRIDVKKYLFSHTCLSIWSFNRFQQPNGHENSSTHIMTMMHFISRRKNINLSTSGLYIAFLLTYNSTSAENPVGQVMIKTSGICIYIDMCVYLSTIHNYVFLFLVLSFAK